MSSVDPQIRQALMLVKFSIGDTKLGYDRFARHLKLDLAIGADTCDLEHPIPITPESRGRSSLLLVGLSAASLMLLIVWPSADISLGGDHYMHLARRFADGFLDVDNLSPAYRDYVVWDGHKYLPFGPLPAVLLIPFVWAFGTGIPLVFYGYAATAANIALFSSVLNRIGLAGERKYWIVLLYFGGTAYLSVTLAGISTFFAHIITTSFLLLAVVEILGKRRLVLAGLFVGLAAASRMTAALALPFFLWLVLQEPTSRQPAERGHRWQGRLLPMALVLAGFATPLLGLAFYNHARFGNPMETGFGLALLYSPVLEAARAEGLFSLAHVPKNLFMMLLQGPELVVRPDGAVLIFPFIRPSPWGMGLFFTTPALIYVFRANLRDPLVQASWLAVAATSVPIVSYYGIGYVQFGYRYALDFMPFLMLLVARGIPAKLSRIAVALITASVVINMWGAIFLGIWI